MKKRAKYLSKIPNLPVKSRLFFGISCIGLALIVQSVILYFFEAYVPMTLFLVSVIIAAWFGGPLIGFLATLLGALAEITVLSPSSMNWATETEIVRLMVYIGQGSVISFVLGEVHRIHRQMSKNAMALTMALERERKNIEEKDEVLRILSSKQIELHIERQRAEQANKVKNLFLANMSHEIRTPLVSILGFAELLKEGRITEETVRRYGSIIERTGNNLLFLINDILDLSKVEAGHLVIEKRPFSVSNLISEVLSVLKVKSEQKQIELLFQKHDGVPEMIVTDANRLRQILINVVGNAIKFTELGFVKIDCIKINSSLQFTVQDTGVGMNQIQKLRLFENFSPGHQTKSGTGLGLSLSKRLSKLLDGDIHLLDSQTGVGSTFTITIPFIVATEIEVESQNNLALGKDFAFEKKSILLVDDSLDNQYLLQTILSEWGFKVVLASNGQEALDEVKKEKFDLILMDMQMPVMDGYTASKELTSKNCRIPIVALTANSMKEDRDRCLEAGCKDYVSKPIQKHQLLLTVKKNLLIEIA